MVISVIHIYPGILGLPDMNVPVQGNLLIVCRRISYNSSLTVRLDDVPHTLDLVIASCNFVENINYLPPLGNSDHSILYFTCDRYAIYKPLVEKFCLSEGRYDELRLLIKMH